MICKKKHRQFHEKSMIRNYFSAEFSKVKERVVGIEVKQPSELICV